MRFYEYSDDDFEDEEEYIPPDEFYTITVGYVTEIKIKAKSQKEAEDEIWKYKWKWNEDILEPEIVKCEEDTPLDDSSEEEYVPVEEFSKSVYVSQNI